MISDSGDNRWIGDTDANDEYSIAALDGEVWLRTAAIEDGADSDDDSYLAGNNIWFQAGEAYGVNYAGTLYTTSNLTARM